MIYYIIKCQFYVASKNVPMLLAILFIACTRNRIS